MQEIIPRYEPTAPRRVNPYRWAIRGLWTLLLLVVTVASLLLVPAAMTDGGEGPLILGYLLIAVTGFGWIAYVGSIFTLLHGKAHKWEEKNSV